MRGSSMYGGAEEGYEVYMFPVPHEEEGHRRTIYPRKDPLALTRIASCCIVFWGSPAPPCFPVRAPGGGEDVFM